MTALRRYLARDARALALVGALMASPAAAGEGADLARIDGEARRLEAAAAFLRDSAARCVGHQRRMVADIAALKASKEAGDAGGPEPGTGDTPARKALWDPVGMRQARLDLYLVQVPRERLAEILEGTVPTGEARAEMERHLALRRACLAWTDRTLARLKDVLRGPVSPGLESRLEEARAMVARDEKRLLALEAAKRPLGTDEIATLETARPGP